MSTATRKDHPTLTPGNKNVADDLPVAVWLGTVPGGEVVYVNPAFEEILGMGPPPDASAGNYVAPYNIRTREGAPYPEREMPYERVLRARDVVVIDDLVVHRSNGKKIPLRVYAKPLFDADGNITHVLEAFHDITREVAAEQARNEGEARLRHAQRLEAVGTLAGGIAHDFNNMLAAIKILVSHLERTEADAQRLRLLGDIDQVVDSAAKLTHALLRFARRGDAALQAVSTVDLLGNVAGLGRRTIDRNIEIATETAGRGIVHADPGQIEQLLMNLVVNARDAMPNGGRLVLRANEQTLACHPTLSPGEYVMLEIEDSGIGIDPQLRERIFEPYYTTKNTGPVKGTGLGLATVYGIVKAHGGAIEVTDTAGGGTTMRVFLPRATSGSEPESIVRAPRSAPRHGSILVVDDEPPVRRAATLALEGLGYRVHAAATGQEAIELFRSHHASIDAVVLDMVMPGLSGRETYLALRSIDASVPVIVTSGLSFSDEAKATLELGARAFTPKPYDAHSLSAMIEEVREFRAT